MFTFESGTQIYYTPIMLAADLTPPRYFVPPLFSRFSMKSKEQIRQNLEKFPQNQKLVSFLESDLFSTVYDQYDQSVNLKFHEFPLGHDLVYTSHMGEVMIGIFSVLTSFE